MAGKVGKIRYHRGTVALWVVLGAFILITSVLALRAGGTEVLYLVITGWIVGPFFLYWVGKKMRGMIGRK